MKAIHTSDEKGQTLIIVAVALTVLLMFVALAIDVGNMYQVRRQMQNAADAGALAGARELCFGDPSQAEARAREYAALNGADPAQTDVEISGGRVDVVARVPADMYVADIMGISTVDVGAHAAAVCGCAESSCGLWPIAFDKALWDEVECGEEFYVWAGFNDSQEDRLSCDCYDCDRDDDGDDEIITNEGRAWLDFAQVQIDDPTLLPEQKMQCVGPGCGQNEIGCWIRLNTPAQVKKDTCVRGDSGVKAANQKPVDDRAGDVVIIPLFDYEGCQPPGDQGSSCKKAFHISDFGCVRVGRWIQNSKKELPWFTLKDPLPEGCDKKEKQSKLIAVTKMCECASNCGSTEGGACPSDRLDAVSLIE